MKTVSNIYPEAYEIEVLPNGMCDILFAENVVETQDAEYVYDLYRLRTPYRENLGESIEANYEAWLEKAKQPPPVVYTEIQQVEQHITDLELMILGG